MPASHGHLVVRLDAALVSIRSGFLQIENELLFFYLAESDTFPSKKHTQYTVPDTISFGREGSISRLSQRNWNAGRRPSVQTSKS